MTVTLMALYGKPADEAAFLRHYEEIHTPLVRQLPGLRELVVSQVTASPLGDAAYFLVAEMRFDNRDAFDAAMNSAENRAAGKDLMSFAKGIVQLIVTETR